MTKHKTGFLVPTLILASAFLLQSCNDKDSFNPDQEAVTITLPDIVGNQTHSSGVLACLFYVANNRMNGSVPALCMRYPDNARKNLYMSDIIS